MLRITGDRGSGKTTALVAVFKADPRGLLVFPNYAVRDYAFRKWPELRALDTAIATNVDIVIAGRDFNLYVDEIGMAGLSSEALRRMVAYSG